MKCALGFISNNNDVKGVHTPNNEIQQTLKSKHPKAEASFPNALLPNSDTTVQTVVFENISDELIQKCSKNLHKSGGPTQIEFEVWKHILCSRSYNREYPV